MEAVSVSMKLIDNKLELKEKFLEVVTYLFERGEMLKAFRVVCDAPSILEEDIDVIELSNSIKTRLSNLAEMQRVGLLEGKMNVGFVDPQGEEGHIKFNKLRNEVLKLGLKKLVDVGCHTGWIGRNLNLDGIAVHGIDIHPIILFYAGIANAGTLATVEFLAAEKLGFTHPLTYDGAVVFDSLEHLFDPEIAIKSIEKSVREGGWLFYNIPHPEAEHLSTRFPNADDREHLNSFSETKLKKLFKDRKNLIIEKIDNSEGAFNWWVQYSI